jgi:Flp pilus assembly protein TadD
LNNFALSLAQNGKVEKAIKLLEPTVLSEKTTVQTRQTLALLYNLSGSFKKGQALMRRDLPTEIVEKNMKIMKSF